MAARRLVSVLVPVLNEEENLGRFHEVVGGVIDAITEVDWEIIFVDDGSTDSTPEKLSALRQADSRVRVIRLSRNFGSYAALRAGFDHAAGDAAITISADLQDPPELFREFVARWSDGFHIVWGVREHRSDPLGKKLLAGAFYWTIRHLGFPDMPEQGMDYGIFDRLVIEAYRQCSDRNLHTHMTLFWMGFRQARVPYDRRARERGASNWPFNKRLKSALDVITGYSYLPLRLSSYLGVAVSATAFLAAAVVLFNRLAFGIGGWGWPSTMISILFLGGVQLVMLGILGEYLWRINTEVRRRPEYIVMEMLGPEAGAARSAVTGPWGVGSRGAR